MFYLSVFLVALAVLHATHSLPAQVVAGPLDPRGFQFRAVDPNTMEPVRFNACAPIHYVINPSLSPPDGVADVHRAVEMTAHASGLNFVYDGTTDEVHSAQREPYQPERYGDRWAPVLISWMSDLQSEAGAGGAGDGRAIGLAASYPETNGAGDPVYVTGVAVFNASADLNSGFGGRTWGQVILHELGHVVGLDHVDQPGSVMNPVLGLRAAAWMEGDRTGLWELGLGRPCVSSPPVP